MHKYYTSHSEALQTCSVEVLDVLLAEHGLGGSDLGRLLGNRPLGNAILRGERQLSKAHIRRLAKHFNVNPGVFI